MIFSFGQIFNSRIKILGNYPLTVGKEIDYTLKKSKREDTITVTVCVALLTDKRANVVGISDRMITAGDIEFEPEQPKIISITNSIVVMTAGDSSFNIEIIAEVKERVTEILANEPDKWLKVSSIARLYQKTLGDLTAQKASASLLRPFGLDSDSFISRQNEMSPSFVEKMATEILNFGVPRVEAIITGVDDFGAHIFVVDNEEIQCFDKLGFASIGVGRWHSNSQLMFDCYTSANDFPSAMFTGYTAKKRAEVAPGVGKDTDMFAIIGLGGLIDTNQVVINELENFYQKMRGLEIDAQTNTKKDWGELVEERVREIELRKKEPEQLQAEASSDGDTSVDKKDIRDGVETR